jgi:hypothetical protein
MYIPCLLDLDNDILYQNLDNVPVEVQMPQLYANLTQNNSVPSTIGGIMWADDVNKVAWTFGGEESQPQNNGLWGYDTILNQWNYTQPTGSSSINQVSWGGNVAVQSVSYSRGIFIRS